MTDQHRENDWNGHSVNATPLTHSNRQALWLHCDGLKLPMNDCTVPHYTGQAAEADMGTTVICCRQFNCLTKRSTRKKMLLFFHCDETTLFCDCKKKKKKRETIESHWAIWTRRHFVASSEWLDASFRCFVRIPDVEMWRAPAVLQNFSLPRAASVRKWLHLTRACRFWCNCVLYCLQRVDRNTSHPDIHALPFATVTEYIALSFFTLVQDVIGTVYETLWLLKKKTIRRALEPVRTYKKAFVSDFHFSHCIDNIHFFFLQL